MVIVLRNPFIGRALSHKTPHRVVETFSPFFRFLFLFALTNRRINPEKLSSDKSLRVSVDLFLWHQQVENFFLEQSQKNFCDFLGLFARLSSCATFFLFFCVVCFVSTEIIRFGKKLIFAARLFFCFSFTCTRKSFFLD